MCENLNWGDDNTTIMWGGGKELLICDDTFLFTSPVGSFPANNFGLYDMYGNVWEWTIDCYQPNLNHIGVSQATETQCKRHPLRGASFAASLKGTTSTYRISEDPDMRTGDYGFRIIREINL